MRSGTFPVLLVATWVAAWAAAPAPAQDGSRPLLLAGARVLSARGDRFLDGHEVLVVGERILAVGPAGQVQAPGDARRVELDGTWLLPGLIDLHSHLLLHPYDEASWNEQVLSESLELRTVRATAAARATLDAGFTTLRELGTEGAAFADVALRDAIEQGVVPGPRLWCATRAIVATGCYGPSGFDPRWSMPVGAQVAAGPVGVRVAVREQIAAGADWIKVYADYRRRPGGPSTPTFSQEELDAICDEARSGGIPVAAHAVTDEAIRRAIRAGAKTIEHGYRASSDTLKAMAEHGVVLCPTLAANEAIVRYAGGEGPVAERLNVARVTFQRALAAGVTIACGSDVGVFAHGDNARELELMVRYGMEPVAALASATRVAAEVLGAGDRIGSIAEGRLADLVAVSADPLQDVSALRKVVFVCKGGEVVRSP